jgi:hypothetical protein
MRIWPMIRRCIQPDLRIQYLKQVASGPHRLPAGSLVGNIALAKIGC